MIIFTNNKKVSEDHKRIYLSAIEQSNAKYGDNFPLIGSQRQTLNGDLDLSRFYFISFAVAKVNLELFTKEGNRDFYAYIARKDCSFVNITNVLQIELFKAYLDLYDSNMDLFYHNKEVIIEEKH